MGTGLYDDILGLMRRYGLKPTIAQEVGEAMTIIDIRSADAYAQGHIKGALNMPWGPNLAENLNKIPADNSHKW